MSFAIGQRWVSQTEPKLGLGIISEFANRRITINFPAAGESRTYASDNAPISRVTYKAGDEISNHEEQVFHIRAVDESRPLLQYEVEDAQGEVSSISEVELNCFIQFTSPLQRLVSGHYDRNRAFRLRYQTLLHQQRLQQSEVAGLLGSRTSLLPHQVFVADSVAKRYSPRVLLADEVGLGKTIEAGMILHAQLHQGLASRVLITVPSTLVYQWLIEMLRRFNLSFSVFDQERFDSLIEEGIENPFESAQLVLCDIDFLSGEEEVCQAALKADWDLLVVDEAHHLHWSETEVSHEYRLVEDLASQARGVLLLTATPEQAGVESHFARLRLLDPDRFHSLAEFKEQELRYAEVSALVGRLQSAPEDQRLDPALKAELETALGEHSGIDLNLPALECVPAAIAQLLDRHGTGRVLFRNTRQAVAGFPQRILHAHPIDQAPQEDPDDLRFDPRLDWLKGFLREHKQDKVLVICRSADHALQIEAQLRLKEGMRTAAFYEDLSIIERDRAAAYFADREEGAQALICSEIGSEGRNFQFASHLVLFDLPDNPDLLEQRIGRLDRIGQQNDVNIHVPYLLNSRQEGMFRWYQEGLDAFVHSCAAGYALFERFSESLEAYLLAGDFASKEAQGFLSLVRQARDEAMAALQTGRDPLLELNSCQPAKAEALIEQLELEEQGQNLSQYMELLFNMYGVEQEVQSDSSVVIRPGEHMLTHDFPGLTEEGMTLTYHRLKALVREEMEFFTWEHPVVVESMEQLLGSELGNAGVVTISVKGVKPGTLFLEAIFCLNSMAPKRLQLDRFLPISPIRVVVNLSGRDLTEVLPHEKINELCTGLRRKLAPAIIKEIRDDIARLHEKAEALVQPKVQACLSQAKEALSTKLNAEIQRMQSLKAQNPLIRDEEIAYMIEQRDKGLEYIDKTGLDIQAMRVIIST